MYIVSTVKNTYLAEEVEETDKQVKLKRAVVVDLNEDNESIARKYVRGTLTSKVVSVNLNNQNVESVHEDDEITPLVEVMLKYVPIAEKNAKANMVLAELSTLMGSVESGDEDDD